MIIQTNQCRHRNKIGAAGGVFNWNKTDAGEGEYMENGLWRQCRIGTAAPNWKLSVAGIGSFDDYVRASYFTATSTTASTFPYASTTALTISGSAYIGSLSNLTGNGFVKTSGGVGTLSVDTSTYLTTVDISANTNLAVTAPVVLTGDTLSLGNVTLYPVVCL